MKIRILICVILVFILGCVKEKPTDTPTFQYGKNEFTISVDGIERNYIVSVPQTYDGQTPIPVVFMLHGTSGNGEQFYNISGWKELGEQENILTVFPSSLSYCYIDNGQQKNLSKWNVQPASWQYCSNVTPPDDVKFLGRVVDELAQKYTIDDKRIYFVGFSNGGGMCAKLSIQMSDRIAAIVESAASFGYDTTFTPKRKLPISFQMGNGDYGPGNVGPYIPLKYLDSLLEFPGHQPYSISQAHIRNFDLNPNYTISGDTNTVVIATYVPNDGNTTNNFNFALIKGLGHQYPNGSNHWMQGAHVQWNWLKQFSLP
jgi:polyhydroxybutyrate depolymerase